MARGTVHVYSHFVFLLLFFSKVFTAYKILQQKQNGLILTDEVTNQEIMRFFSSRYEYISIINRIKEKNEKGIKKKKLDNLIGIIVKIFVFELVYSMFISAAKTQDRSI